MTKVTVDRPRFVHADLFPSKDAATLVSKSVLDRIKARRGGPDAIDRRGTPFYPA